MQIQVHVQVQVQVLVKHLIDLPVLKLLRLLPHRLLGLAVVVVPGSGSGGAGTRVLSQEKEINREKKYKQM